MKVITYKGEKWYHARTQYHGIVGKTRYFVNMNPRTQRWKDDDYYTYSVIHRFTPSIIFSAVLLIICSIGFILSSLGKVLLLLLAGQVKAIFDKETYTQGLNGEDNSLLDAIDDVWETLDDDNWCQWYTVRSEQPLTYKELRKVVRDNKDFERTIIEVRDKQIQQPIDNKMLT